MSDSEQPHRLQPTRLPYPWDPPGKNTGMGYISFSNVMFTYIFNLTSPLYSRHYFILLRESITRQVDKKFRVPEEERGVWGSQRGDKGLEFSRMRKGQMSFFPSTFLSLQFSSVAQSCPTLYDPMNRSTPGLSVHHHLPEFTQTRVHQVTDAIQPSHPLLSPSPPAHNPSHHQSLFQ